MAGVAFVRFFAGVSPQVACQIMFGTVAFAAYRALILFIPGVKTHVTLQSRFPRKQLLAYVALAHGFQRGVQDFVLFQQRGIQKYFAARLAGMGDWHYVPALVGAEIT